VVEHLPSKHKALNSNPSTTGKKKKKKKKKRQLYTVFIFPKSMTQGPEEITFKMTPKKKVGIVR
jgi:hypothetical protein